MSSFTIHPVRTSADLTSAIALFEAYAISLGIDLKFQNFANEMANMPGKYSPEQRGALLLARSNNRIHCVKRGEGGGENEGEGEGEAGEVLGCVALRSLPLPSTSSSSIPSSSSTISASSNGICEMKRLYVAPAGRGRGVGKALAEAIVAEARRLQYRAVKLDTLPSMTAAQGLYAQMGFVPIEKYYDTPMEETVFLELDLTK